MDKPGSNLPQLAQTGEDIEQCFEVMSELRTHLDREQFVDLVRDMMGEGYRLAYIKEGVDVVAVAGYRVYTNLFMGKHLYVDDLVTADAARSRGFGEQMIKWLRNEACKEGCNYFHLDSGTHRGRAHKFYFQQGFTIASYHFSEELRD